MAGITQDMIPDLQRITKKEFGELKFSDLTTDLQDLLAMRELLRDEKVTLEGGSEIQWEVMINPLNNFRNVGLYAADEINDGDQLEVASVKYRHATGGYSYERRLLNMNKGSKYKILDYIQTKRIGGMLNVAQGLETNFWEQAASDDGFRPFSIRYWAGKKVTGNSDGTGIGEFGGTTVWTSTYPGGLNNARWANWTNKYTTTASTDLVRKIWYAFMKCQFKTPIPHPDAARGPHRYAMYTVIDTLEGLIQEARNQNENLGFDLAAGTKELVFMGRPIRWVPILENDADDPFYGIDWNRLFPVFLEGEYMQETFDPSVSGQHTVARTHIDNSYNLKCTDRRALFVFAKANTN